MADTQHLQPILESFGSFKPLKTYQLFTLHLLFTLILDVISIVYAVQHPEETFKCREYFIVLYLHVAYWVLTFIIHYVTKYMHQAVKLNGYLDFHRATQTHTSLPIIIVSLWTAVLLLVQTLMQHYFPDDFAKKCIEGGGFSPRFNLCALITLECFAIAGVNISYIMKVINFNKERPPPDVQKEDWSSAVSPDTLYQNEVGYRELGGKVYELLDKQAELITFLKEHNAKLAEKVMLLNTQLQQSGGGEVGINS